MGPTQDGTIQCPYQGVIPLPGLPIKETFSSALRKFGTGILCALWEMLFL